MIAPQKQFFCNGEVTMWRYQALSLNAFQAMVFRPVDGGHTQFRVVGVNNIPAGEIVDAPVSYNVSESDRIMVQRGDVIGWSFKVGVLTYDIPSDSNGNNLVRYINKTQYLLHDIITFDSYGSREYSIEATVDVSVNFNLFL